MSHGVSELVEMLRAPEVPTWYKAYYRRFQQKLAQEGETVVLKESNDFLDGIAAVSGIDPRAHTCAQILLLDSPTANAHALKYNGAAYVVLHRGFLSLLSFVNEAVALGQIGSQIEPRITLKDLVRHGLGRWPNSRTINGLATGLAYSYILQPIKLPKLLTGAMGVRHHSGAMHSTARSELFALLHECAHVELGHLDGESPIRDELGLTEGLTAPSNQECNEEIEADAYAFEVTERSKRSELALGACIYLRVLAMAEFLADKGSDERHPLAINRLKAILNRFRDDLDATATHIGELTISGLEDDYRVYGSEEGRENRDRILLLGSDILRDLMDGLSPGQASWTLLAIANCIGSVAPREDDSALG